MPQKKNKTKKKVKGSIKAIKKRTPVKKIKKVAKKTIKKASSKPKNKKVSARKTTKKLVKKVATRNSAKKLKDEQVNEVIGILKAKNDIRGFVTFGEILNLIQYPEYNIAGLDKIFDLLLKDNVIITKNLEILEVDRDISVNDLVRSTSLEE